MIIENQSKIINIKDKHKIIATKLTNQVKNQELLISRIVSTQ